MAERRLSEIESCGLTHIGKVREDNQDAIRLCSPDDEFTPLFGHLYGMADGMGGYAHGGMASALALSTLFDVFYASDGISVPQKLKLGVQNANMSVYQTARRIGAGRMGTTLTAVHVDGNRLHIAHVGDSRVYLIRGGQATCLTNDHTRVGEMVRMRILSPDKVRKHNQRSILNKCLGIDLFIQPDISQATGQDGDILIVCCDGIWSVIEDEEFANLASATPDPAQLAQEIFELAMIRESDDNLSVIVLCLRHLVHDHATADKAPFLDRLPRFLRFPRR